ncbi:MAG: hypothetical protein ACOYI8_11255 [Christensenellales bacterium]
MKLREKDVAVLRDLASRYAEFALAEKQNETKRLWLKLNHAEMERPMVLCDQLPWGEMDVDGSLICSVEDPYWRGVEEALRQNLYLHAHMPADRVFLPYIALPRPISNSGWGLKSQVDRLQEDPQSGAASQHIHCVINGYEDIEKIQMPVISLDSAREKEIIQAAHMLFDGIIPFKMTGVVLHLGIWDTISYWMGVTQCYIELLDRPEMIHALMEKLVKGLNLEIEQMNEQGLWDVYSHMCHCSHTFRNDVPAADCDFEHPLSKDAWSFGLAQLFTSVSPAVTKEFEVDYMARVFDKIGCIYYGCCDRMDDRLDIIMSLPNIRKISCSPWSDREAFARKLDPKIVMSNKPTPAYLATDSFHEDIVRDDLRRTIACAKENGLSLELILKDVSTIRHDPKRLWRWQEIAMEEVSR